MIYDVTEGNYDATLPTFVDPSNMIHYHLSIPGIVTVKKVKLIKNCMKPKCKVYIEISSL